MRKPRRIAAALALSATLASASFALAAVEREDTRSSSRPGLFAWLVELFAPVSDPSPVPPAPAAPTPPPESGDGGPMTDPNN